MLTLWLLVSALSHFQTTDNERFSKSYFPHSSTLPTENIMQLCLICYILRAFLLSLFSLERAFA